MARFKVGDNPRSLFDIHGHMVAGGTWHTPEGIGVPEAVLKKEFPFLVWEGKEKKKAGIKEVRTKVKLSKEQFFKLNRKQQEAELKKLGIKFSKKDKEADLWDKYKQ
jgi:hypothetical protein